MHLDNTEAQAEQIEWTAKLGEPVKFIDEQAVLEAHQQVTCFPMLYYGRLIDVFLIRFHSKCIPYAQIKPFWDAPDKFIPLSNVLLPDNTTPTLDDEPPDEEHDPALDIEIDPIIYDPPM